MASADNLSAVLHGIKDIRLENTPIPEISENEVLLRMAQVGICGSDISLYTKGRIGGFIAKAPLIVGHEAAGVVEKCGSAVKHLKPGDRVAIEPGIPCRTCKFCKEGRYNLCPNLRFCSAPPTNGNLAKYYKHAADFCYKLPDNVSLEEGALMEPLSVAVHACRRANITLGSRVLVCGAGPIGLVSLLAAKAMGATDVCITDIVDEKLKLAKELGADSTLNVKSGNPEDLAKQVIELMGGEMPNIVIECTGFEPSIKLAIFATETGGVIVMVGVGSVEVSIPIVMASFREVDIRGIFTYANCYPLALDMIASGRVNVKPLITHRFKMEQAVEAFETVRAGAGGVIKAMISC